MSVEQFSLELQLLKQVNDVHKLNKNNDTRKLHYLTHLIKDAKNKQRLIDLSIEGNVYGSWMSVS